MPECAICQQALKHNGALFGHVRFKHGVTKENYLDGKYKPTILVSPAKTVQSPQTTPPLTQTIPQPVPAPQPQNVQPQTIPPQQSTVQGLTESNLENIADRLYHKLQGNTTKDLPPGVSAIEGLEEVEVIGEKINYKVALNPDVFWRWNVFKGQNSKLVAMGKAVPFQGDFADFLDLSTKTLLSTFGMYPTVMMMSGGKMLVEMPVQQEED